MSGINEKLALLENNRVNFYEEVDRVLQDGEDM
jgi:hypothetical protein